MKELRYFICLFLMIISLSVLCSCSVEQGPIGPQGVQGETGNGISSITLTKQDGLVDTYTIYFTDGSTTTFTVTNGKDGSQGIQGIQGEPGKDGHTPVITVENGNWYIDGVDTGKKAQGLKGETGNGIRSIVLTESKDLVDTYTIYYTDGSTTTFTVTNGKDGTQGIQGIQGEPGKDGHTPVITIENGNWYIDGVDTLQPAQGVQGETGNGISSIKLTNTDGLVDTYTIYFTDGTTTTFTVTNGKDSNDNNSLYGLNVLCVGDSITAGQGMNQNERWANVLAEKYDWNLTVNAAGGIPMSSYYYTENSLNDISICKKIEILAQMNEKPELIIVWGGHNDTSYRNSPLGSFDDISEKDSTGVIPTYADKNSFKGSLRYISEVVHTFAPTSTMVVLTPEWTKSSPSTLKVPEGTTDTNWMFNDAIYEGAKYYGWVPINMQLCGITPYTKDVYTSDGVHPNKLGTELIVNYLSNELEKLNYIKNNDDNNQSFSINFDSNIHTIEVGNSKELKVSIVPDNSLNQKLVWSSSNENVVTVNNGVITGVNIGEATIKVETEDKKQWSTCIVKVLNINGHYILEQKGETSHSEWIHSSFLGTQYFVYDGENSLEKLQEKTITHIFGGKRTEYTGQTTVLSVYLVDLNNPLPTEWKLHQTITIDINNITTWEIDIDDLFIPKGYTVGFRSTTPSISTFKKDPANNDALNAHYYDNISDNTSTSIVLKALDFRIE